MKNTILKYALLNALGTAFYIVLVASFFFYGLKRLGPGETVLIPMAMLMLLVLSASLTGALIFGRPVMWYVDGKKKEALSLLGYTLGFFLVITLVAFGALVVHLK